MTPPPAQGAGFDISEAASTMILTEPKKAGIPSVVEGRSPAEVELGQPIGLLVAGFLFETWHYHERRRRKSWGSSRV